jgi:dTDP-4-dehydrorhamnose reductase
VALMLRDLARGQRPYHALLPIPGWWRRPDRHLHGFARSDDGALLPRRSQPSINQLYPDVPPLLITGGRGTLGRAFGRVCERRGIPYRLLTRCELDVADAASVRQALDRFRPWAVVNAAGYVRVDDAEEDERTCFRENVDGSSIVALACALRALPMVTFSSDLVFDGSKCLPYIEDDAVVPLNVYGRSKVEAERRVREAHSGALIVRTSAFFGPWDDANFVSVARRALETGDTIVAPDQVISPTYVPDLADATLDLLIDGESGIWHLTNQGEVSWVELAKLVADMVGVSGGEVCRVAANLAARRPAYSVLGSRRGQLLPDLDDVLARYMHDTEF